MLVIKPLILDNIIETDLISFSKHWWNFLVTIEALDKMIENVVIIEDVSVNKVTYFAMLHWHSEIMFNSIRKSVLVKPGVLYPELNIFDILLPIPPPDFSFLGIFDSSLESQIKLKILITTWSFSLIKLMSQLKK